MGLSRSVSCWCACRGHAGRGAIGICISDCARQAPTGVAATPGNATAVVKWTAPSNDGGHAITGYTATATPGSKTCTTTSAKTCTIHSLTNGTTYTVSVKAKNSKGFGATSAHVTVKPGVPLAPTAVKGTAGNGAAEVRWTAPASNGSSITHYTVTSSPGSKSCTTAGEPDCTVTGLSNGTHYTFKVSAKNARGTGAASAPSASVTPTSTPTIAVGAFPYAISSDSSSVWVTHPGFGDTVTEFDVDGLNASTFDVPVDPDAISSDGTHVWVAFGEGFVEEFAGDSEINSITVGTDPDAISSDGTHVWVANSGDNTVTELDASDEGGVVNTITVGTGPDAISSDGTSVWVANSGDNTVTDSTPRPAQSSTRLPWAMIPMPSPRTAPTSGWPTPGTIR